MTDKYLRLGVNIDHVATIRNARGGAHPDPVNASIIAQNAGADGITAHLREDRRHISDDDIMRLKDTISLPLNFEMAATEEMLAIALRVKPHAVCIVPEKREEVTTEGGLDLSLNTSYLKEYIAKLKDNGSKVSLFIEALDNQLYLAKELSADIVEFHTGAYAHKEGAAKAKELAKIQQGARLAATLGIEPHAGHGLTYDNVIDIARIPELKELNIGHFLIGEAIFVGLTESIRNMKKIIKDIRESL